MKRFLRLGGEIVRGDSGQGPILSFVGLGASMLLVMGIVLWLFGPHAATRAVPLYATPVVLVLLAESLTLFWLAHSEGVNQGLPTDYVAAPLLLWADGILLMFRYARSTDHLVPGHVAAFVVWTAFAILAGPLVAHAARWKHRAKARRNSASGAGSGAA